jgi:arylsulfatase A-like enzyme
MNHVENELIDKACARVLAHLAVRGWADDTDVIFTTDHGELQGDFGLLFKGPYHVDALMRVPLVWRPAPSAGVPHADVTRPVGHLDLAATFCTIAGIATPDRVEGQPLPVSDAEADRQHRERVLTEWDSEHGRVDMHLRTIYRDQMVCTAYEKSSVYAGDEGELYDLATDPDQRHNLWDDPDRRSLRRALVADLYDHLPARRSPRLPRGAPV